MMSIDRPFSIYIFLFRSQTNGKQYEMYELQLYEFHVLEYRWGVHILVKSIDDIRNLDQKIRSIYNYSSLRDSLPVLPRLKLGSSATNQIDGFTVAEEHQQYFNALLQLEGSAFCPDLLM